MPELYRGPEAADQPPEYVAQRTTASHGALLAADEHAWSLAVPLRWGPHPYATAFRAVWTDDALVVRFDAADRAPWFTRQRRDDCLWEEEVVEIFVDPTCTGSDYVELEISPANVVCDLHIASLEPRDVRLHWDFTSLETSVISGNGDDWTAVACLPFDDLGSVCPAVAARMPARPGDVWHFNAFRIKRPHGPAEPDRDVLYCAWSVPDGNTFHTPAAFRPLRFADRG